ncbi:thioesterase II family protein [Massilia sp. TWP1-3-3]|uniref:thioesterase II family protein n=1 Tax=Massilia sp. TWP1-3-3 TaxID=2804573 RepID=UPI003CEB5914
MASSEMVFDVPRPDPGAAMRVFCFPFAGGGSATYHGWLDQLHPQAELVTVQMPARGTRLADAPCDNMAELVDSLFAHIAPLLDKPYVFFGHSMGSKVAFELASRLHRDGLPLPLHFIASASPAPFLPRAEAPIHALPDAQFIARLASLNGTPQRILQSRELMALLMPAMRADFKLLANYVGHAGTVLPTTLTLCGGSHDDALEHDDMLAWRRVFAGAGELHIFDGGHFYLNEHGAALVALINRLIEAAVLAELPS